MKTINLYQWMRDFHMYRPGTYRLGQHFINCFIKVEVSEPLCKGLWEETNSEVINHTINLIISKYHWDATALPLLINAPEFDGGVRYDGYSILYKRHI